MAESTLYPMPHPKEKGICSLNSGSVTPISNTEVTTSDTKDCGQRWTTLRRVWHDQLRRVANHVTQATQTGQQARIHVHYVHCRRKALIIYDAALQADRHQNIEYLTDPGKAFTMEIKHKIKFP